MGTLYWTASSRCILRSCVDSSTKGREPDVSLPQCLPYPKHRLWPRSPVQKPPKHNSRKEVSSIRVESSTTCEPHVLQYATHKRAKYTCHAIGIQPFARIQLHRFNRRQLYNTIIERLEHLVRHELTQLQQCLEIDPRPIRCRNVHHVGHYVPRTTTPAHCTATKRLATGAQYGTLDKEGETGY